MQVRKYNEADHAQLVLLWQTVFPDDPPHNDPVSMIAAKLAVDDLIFVAVDGKDMIGACMAGYDGHRGWLYAVAVSPEQRRDNTGTALVEHAVDSLRQLGCIKVNLQIRSSNTEVAAFYKSLGFGVEDRLSMGARI